MRRIKAIHQIMPGFLYGDALGNQAARIRELLRGWGFDSQVYAQFRDRRLSDPGLDYRRYVDRPESIVIFHYSIASPVSEFVRSITYSPVILYYHNVTPPEYLRKYNSETADLLARGREDLASFRDSPFSLAASDYNCGEMLQIGFQNVAVLPYFVYFDELLRSADSPKGRDVLRRLDDGWTNLLFVGRIVPNKRQDDLVRVFNYYHKLVNPKSRLFLIGSDANAPGYRLELEIMAEALGLQHVHLTGPVGLREGLGGYFRAASLFLCMSEHEGFCVPLLEAMAFDKPVVALAAAGVPYALGDAGVLIKRKRYDVIGELIDLVMRDKGLRTRIVAGQRKRLAQFAPSLVAERMRRYIEGVVRAVEAEYC